MRKLLAMLNPMLKHRMCWRTELRHAGLTVQSVGPPRPVSMVESALPHERACSFLVVFISQCSGLTQSVGSSDGGEGEVKREGYEVMVMVSFFAAERPAESCTLNVGAVAPITVGVPLMTPAALNVSPAGSGSEPVSRLQL